jgi:eukaryotic-like serine/threonine-protein kinase
VYVETVARKGYRFIAPMTLPADSSVAMPLPAPAQAAWPAVPGNWIWIFAAAVVIVVAMLNQKMLRRESAGVLGPVSFVVSMPQNTRLAGRPYNPSMAVSPDGESMVFVAAGPEGASMYLRQMASEINQRLDGTEDAALPFWAPDGREVGFYSQGKLKAVPVSGGPVRVLCDAPQFFGGTWAKDGTILFGSDFVLFKIAARGGARTQVTFTSPAASRVGTLDGSRGDFRHSWPQFLPDGRRFLYFIADSDPLKTGVFLGSLDGASPRLLFLNATRAMFSGPDFLLYVRDGSLFAQHWDTVRWRSRGEAALIAQGVNVFSTANAGFTVSEAGVLAYRTGSPKDSQLVVRDRDGKRLKTVGPPASYVQFAISPDEKMAALNVRLARDQSWVYRLWLYNVQNEVISQLDFGEESQADPVWSPDSKRVAFAAFPLEGMKTRLLLWNVGDAAPQFLFADGNSNKPDDWSPDGRLLLCRRNDILAFTVPVKDKIESDLVGDMPARKDQLRFSPNQKMVAYNQGRPPLTDVFIADFPGFTARTQVSLHRGVQPVWRRDGKELFYLALDGTIMSVAIESAAALTVGSPKALFNSGVSWLNQYSDGVSQYAPSADGKRFYLLEPVQSPPEGELHVVTRWQARLRP